MIRILSLALLLSLPALSRAEATEAYAGGVTITSKALAAELASYIEADLAAKGGWLIIQDPVKKKLVKLKPSKLDSGAHIHRLGELEFLSWGEFKAENGDEYMIDFYFNVVEGRLKMSVPLTIYSVNKKKRYDWDESGEIMKKLDVKKGAKK